MDENVPGIVTRSRRRLSVDSVDNDDSRSAAGTPTKRGRPARRLSLKPELEDVIESKIATPLKAKNTLNIVNEEETIPSSPVRVTRTRKSLSLLGTTDSPTRNVRTRSASTVSPEGAKESTANNLSAPGETKVPLETVTSKVINKIVLTTVDSPKPRRNKRSSLGGTDTDASVGTPNTRRSRRLSTDLNVVQEDPINEEKLQLETITPGPKARRGKRLSTAPLQPSLPEEVEVEEAHTPQKLNNSVVILHNIPNIESVLSPKVITRKSTEKISPVCTDNTTMGLNTSSKSDVSSDKISKNLFNTSVKSPTVQNDSAENIITNTSLNESKKTKLNQSTNMDSMISAQDSALNESLKKMSEVSVKLDIAIDRDIDSPKKPALNTSKKKSMSPNKSSSNLCTDMNTNPEDMLPSRRSTNRSTRVSGSFNMSAKEESLLSKSSNETNIDTDKINSSPLNHSSGINLSPKVTQNVLVENVSMSNKELITSPIKLNKKLSALDNKDSNYMALRSSPRDKSIVSKSVNVTEDVEDEEAKNISLKLENSSAEEDFNIFIIDKNGTHSPKNVSMENKNSSDKSTTNNSLNASNSNNSAAMKNDTNSSDVSPRISPRRKSAKDYFVEEVTNTKTPQKKDTSLTINQSPSQNTSPGTEASTTPKASTKLATSTPIPEKREQNVDDNSTLFKKALNISKKKNTSMQHNSPVKEPLQKSKINNEDLYMSVSESVMNSEKSQCKIDLNESSKKAKKDLQSYSESSSEDDTDDGGDFIDNAAIDAGSDYLSGDSMDESEAKEIVENEIIDKGISLNTESSDNEDDSYEKDSFICTSSEEDEDLLSGSGDDLSLGNDELTFSKKSKTKFNEKESKKIKNASKEMYEARHSQDSNTDKTEKSTKKQYHRIQSVSENSDSSVNAMNTTNDPLSVTYLQNSASKEKSMSNQEDDQSISSLSEGDEIINITNMFDEQLAHLQKNNTLENNEGSNSSDSSDNDNTEKAPMSQNGSIVRVENISLNNSKLNSSSIASKKLDSSKSSKKAEKNINIDTSNISLGDSKIKTKDISLNKSKLNLSSPKVVALNSSKSFKDGEVNVSKTVESSPNVSKIKNQNVSLNNSEIKELDSSKTCKKAEHNMEINTSNILLKNSEFNLSGSTVPQTLNSSQSSKNSELNVSKTVDSSLNISKMKNQNISLNNSEIKELNSSKIAKKAEHNMEIDTSNISLNDSKVKTKDISMKNSKLNSSVPTATLNSSKSSKSSEMNVSKTADSSLNVSKIKNHNASLNNSEIKLDSNKSFKNSSEIVSSSLRKEVLNESNQSKSSKKRHSENTTPNQSIKNNDTKKSDKAEMKEKIHIPNKEFNADQPMTIAGLIKSLPESVAKLLSSDITKEDETGTNLTSTTPFDVEITNVKKNSKKSKKRKLANTTIGVIENDPTWTCTAGEFSVAKKYKENPTRPVSASNSGYTTCFNVVSLKKNSKQILKVDNQLSSHVRNFKQDMLFGSRVRREGQPCALLNIEKKIKAKNKYTIR